MADCASPLARAEVCVTLPSSFEPFGNTVFPADFTSEVVLASTASPTLAFLLSSDLVSLALMAVPLARPAFAPLGLALALAAPCALAAALPVVELWPCVAFTSCVADVFVFV